MTDLFWPGDERAGDHLTSAALLRAMSAVERSWLDVLGRPTELPELTAEDLEGMARAAERDGTPAVPLVRLLRKRLEGAGHEEAARWLHRGLTSQDVVDSAVMVTLRDAVADIRVALATQVEALVVLAEMHRDTPAVARTLTQYAVPTTFGLKAATWLDSVLEVDDDLADLVFPLQLGGAASTMAAAVELGVDVSVARDRLATSLGLTPTRPWHTTRGPVTRIGDAAVCATDAWGRIANDVLTLSRSEIAELSEASTGGSSTMPHKQNPVLATLVRRAALVAPQLGSTLHLAAAESGDERSAGPWQAEWATVATLVRRALVAALQMADLLAGLEVHPHRMRENLAAAGGDVFVEQRGMADLAGREPRGDYLGTAGVTVDDVLLRARSWQEKEST